MCFIIVNGRIAENVQYSINIDRIDSFEATKGEDGCNIYVGGRSYPFLVKESVQEILAKIREAVGGYK